MLLESLAINRLSHSDMKRCWVHGTQSKIIAEFWEHHTTEADRARIEQSDTQTGHKQTKREVR